MYDGGTVSKKGGVSRRSRERAIQSLRRRLEENQQKLAAEPDAQAVRHWLHENEEWERQIRDQERRLGHDRSD